MRLNGKSTKMKNGFYLLANSIVCILYIIALIMGCGGSRSYTRSKPSEGFKIVKITNQALHSKLNLFTDYIISPSFPLPKSANKHIQVIIFNILDCSKRKVILPFASNQIGARIRKSKIRDNVLKITKILQHSPLKELSIFEKQYIVGVSDVEYQDVYNFNISMRKLVSRGDKEIELAVCDAYGRSRMVKIPQKMKRRLADREIDGGVLGCEYQQGEVNRYNEKIRRFDIIPTGSEIEGQPQFSIEKDNHNDDDEKQVQEMIQLEKSVLNPIHQNRLSPALQH